LSKQQRVFLSVACWVALLTAGLHMLGHAQGAPVPANDTEATLLKLMSSYKIDAAGTRLTVERLLDGFSLSLSFSLSLAWVGGLGLLVLRRGDPNLVRGVALVDAILTAVLLAISVTHFPLPPTVCIAVMLIGFVGATIGSPSQ
jgi:hypothetical protein